MWLRFAAPLPSIASFFSIAASARACCFKVRFKSSSALTIASTISRSMSPFVPFTIPRPYLPFKTFTSINHTFSWSSTRRSRPNRLSVPLPSLGGKSELGAMARDRNVSRTMACTYSKHAICSSEKTRLCYAGRGGLAFRLQVLRKYPRT